MNSGLPNAFGALRLRPPYHSHAYIVALVWQAAGDSVESPEGLIRLWAHECLRVFHDRLVDERCERIPGSEEVTRVVINS